MKHLVKSIHVLVILFLFSMSHLLAQKAPEWAMDTALSEVNFLVKHVFLPVNGSFKEFQGDFLFHPIFPIESKAAFRIKVSSIKTDNKDRDRHLQSPDFFDAVNYPEIVFESSQIEKVSKNEFSVKGNLMMRGVTKEIEFSIMLNELISHPKKDGMMLLKIDLNTTVDRSDYGIGRGNWASSSAIGNKVKISINLVLETNDAYFKDR